MKKTLHLFLLAMMSACASAATVVPPHNTLEWTNPTLNADGSPLADLVSVTFTCGGVPFTVPTTTPGASLSEPLPAGVLALSGAVSCTGIATSTSGGDSIIPSNNSDRWCDGTACYDAQPAYCAAGTCYDAVPPDPPTLGDGGQAGGGTSALALAAAGLSPGESVAFTAPPGADDRLHWQSTWHCSAAVTGKCVLLGKAPGGTADYYYQVYDIAANTWTAPASFITGTSGHIYGTSTMDPTDGRVIISAYSNKFAHIWDPVSDTWSTTSTWSIPNTSTGPHSAVVFHPNLFGAGQKGLLVDAGFDSQPIVAWRESDDTWSIAMPGPTGSPGRTGVGAYLPAIDSALIGGSDNAGAVGKIITPGPTVTVGAAFPMRLTGDTFGNSANTYGAVMAHPADPSKWLILQNGTTNSTGRAAYESADGINWTQVADHHFSSGQGWVFASVPELGVVWGVSADGQSVIEKF